MQAEVSPLCFNRFLLPELTSGRSFTVTLSRSRHTLEMLALIAELTKQKPQRPEWLL